MDKIFFVDYVRRFIKRDPVTIDGRIFRLHHKFTVLILLIFCLLVTSTQFFGDPILCIEAKDVPQALLNTYCWIEGTFTLPGALTKAVGSEVAAPGVEQLQPKEDAVEHSYYQWVCFVFLFQAICFCASRVFWASSEGGRIENLVLKLDNPILPDSEKEANINQLVQYFAANLHKHTTYVLHYLACEVFNFIHVILQIFFIDRFLGGEFSQYGPDVVQFLNRDQEVRYDPMIKVFPMVTKCRFHRYGSSGDVQRYDAMCVLPINVLNSKLFVFLWFWFVVLAILSGCSLLYRLALLWSPRLRYIILHSTNRLTPKDVLDTVLTKFSYGDWFILHRLSTNLDHANCRDLMIAIAHYFEERSLKMKSLDGRESEKLNGARKPSGDPEEEIRLLKPGKDDSGTTTPIESTC